MNNKDLFRLKHIFDSIEKIEYIARMLHTQDNFESKWIEHDAMKLQPDFTNIANFGNT